MKKLIIILIVFFALTISANAGCRCWPVTDAYGNLTTHCECDD
jgi:hypothetical protein